MLSLDNAIYIYSSTKEKEWYYNQFKDRIKINMGDGNIEDWYKGIAGIIFCHGSYMDNKHTPYVENIPTGARYRALSKFTCPWVTFEEAVILAAKDPDTEDLSEEEYMRTVVHSMD